jgi:hypothetical protein
VAASGSASASASATRSEHLPGPSGEATVVLDIGASRGALVVYLAERMNGREVEIRPEGTPWMGQHTAVRRRDVRAGACFAAVFGSLPPGVHQLRECGTGMEPVLAIAVAAGRVTEVDWPEEKKAREPIISGSRHPSP